MFANIQGKWNFHSLIESEAKSSHEFQYEELFLEKEIGIKQPKYSQGE